jgi:hypothetical protein
MTSGAFSTIDSISTTGWDDIIGLQFNTNDNMLYVINSHFSTSAPSELIRVNPSGGHTTVATLPFTIDPEYYSSVFDQCNNHYVLSAKTTAGATMLARFNTSGSMVSYHTTTGLLMGLDIKY